MKRKIKKSIAIILAISMLGSSNIAVFANQLTTEEQIMQTPDAVLTKGQFVALLNASLKLDNGTGENFKDVKSDSPFYKDLLIAKTTGYLKGDGFGSIYPDQLITGAEAITCINFFLGFDMSKVNIINGLNVPTWAQAPASNLIDLTMIDKSMAEKKTITADDAKKLVDAITVATMFSDSPYGLKQVSLQENFYSYVNRRFLATSKPLPGYSSASHIDNMEFNVNNQIDAILQESINTSNAPVNSDSWKIKEIYNMYMDNEARTKSLEKIKPIINDIKNVKTLKELTDVRNKYNDYYDIESKFFVAVPAQDMMVDASKWSAIYTYSPLGLPNKDYYADNENVKPIQEIYKKSIANTLKYIGETEDLPNRAEAYYKFEKSLADKQKSLAEQADLSKSFTPISQTEIDSITHNLYEGIETKYKTLDEKMKKLNAYCPDKEYIKFADDIYKEENLDLLKDIMMMSVLNTIGTYLGNDYLNINKDLNIAIYGDSGDVPENIKAQSVVKTILPNTISELYVEKYADKNVKKQVEKMCEEIRNKRIERVQKLDWMSQKTKDTAIDKLKSIKFYIAHPDTFSSDLNSAIIPKSSGGTLIDVYYSFIKSGYSQFEARLDKPANESVWTDIRPYTVNALYNRAYNAVIIPNAFLQTSVYDATKSEEYNLGRLGIIIGHELTHAVDTNGAMFDKNGTIKVWWTEEDLKAFQTLASSVSAELSKISLGDGMQVNGDLVVSEVVSDLGGVAAVTDLAKDKNLNLVNIYGSFADVFVMRAPKESVMKDLTDVHPPMMIRVNFSISQQDGFYKVFNVKPGDKMYVEPEKRLNIW